jgi:hypothetical protein
VGNRLAIGIVGLAVAGMLSGCSMLQPPVPMTQSENIGADASGSRVVTATKDPDAIQRHLAVPAPVDEFNLSPPPAKKRSHAESTPAEQYEYLRKEHIRAEQHRKREGR